MSVCTKLNCVSLMLLQPYTVFPYASPVKKTYAYTLWPNTIWNQDIFRNKTVQIMVCNLRNPSGQTVLSLTVSYQLQCVAQQGLLVRSRVSVCFVKLSVELISDQKCSPPDKDEKHVRSECF